MHNHKYFTFTPARDNDVPKNEDPKCPYIDLKPPTKIRKIADVKLNSQVYPLERHLYSDY